MDVCLSLLPPPPSRHCLLLRLLLGHLHLLLTHLVLPVDLHLRQVVLCWLLGRLPPSHTGMQKACQRVAGCHPARKASLGLENMRPPRLRSMLVRS
ncbi:hypothetical protein FHR59_002316 [Xanthomonas arboricola]|nr:hypothetical protein [Xanthomonas arboricola]